MDESPRGDRTGPARSGRGNPGVRAIRPRSSLLGGAVAIVMILATERLGWDGASVRRTRVLEGIPVNPYGMSLSREPVARVMTHHLMRTDITGRTDREPANDRQAVPRLRF